QGEEPEKLFARLPRPVEKLSLEMFCGSWRVNLRCPQQGWKGISLGCLGTLQQPRKPHVTLA
ncbi:MAG: hypothetical protein ACK55I_42180, partial [bacterium]